MPTNKRVKFTPAQVDKINLIPDKKGKTAKFRTLATKWKIPMGKVRGKWYSERAKTDTGIKKPSALILVIDTTVLHPTKSKADEQERIRLQKAIDAVIPHLKPMKGNIPIDNKYAGIARKHLDANYPTRKFVFSKIKVNGKPSGITRIFAK